MARLDSPRLIQRADAVLGDALERTVEAHHRRRLRRLGHEGVLDPPDDGMTWAAGAAPPRPGNSVEVLIDGAAGLGAIEEELRGARSHVHIAGWHMTPDFALRRDSAVPTLRSLLAELAERVEVRVLLWAGAPVPVFKLARKAVRECRRQLTEGTRVRCALDDKERPMHCHHEKLVIVDDSVAFVGGIDMTSLAGDRWDEPSHPARGRLGWHDATTRLRGPIVADVAAHFAGRWREVDGEQLEPPRPSGRAGTVEAQLVSTVPEKVYDFAPRGRFAIVESYLRAVRSAERLVYLENQFLWSTEVCAVLAEKLERPPSADFRVLVVLPEKANNGQDDTRGQLGKLTEADERGGGGRMLGCTLRSRSAGRSERLYVHAKIGIVDDRWLTVGSANLNAHSFFNDSEVNVVTCDAELARDTRLRLWSEHLERSVDDVSGDPSRVVDELWRPIATEQRARMQRGEPLTHHLVQLPGVSRRSGRLRGPVDSLLVDG